MSNTCPLQNHEVTERNSLHVATLGKEMWKSQRDQGAQAAGQKCDRVPSQVESTMYVVTEYPCHIIVVIPLSLCLSTRILYVKHTEEAHSVLLHAEHRAQN